MSNLPQTFDFNGLPIDVHIIDGEPRWIAKDVCEVLELGNPRSSLASLDDDEKGVHTVDTLGGPQQVTVINESGLYSLILRSRKPVAKQFKRWVTHEVIPQIRKTGAYIAPGSDASLAIANAFDRLAERMEAQTQAITSQIADLSQRVVKLEVHGLPQPQATRVQSRRPSPQVLQPSLPAAGTRSEAWKPLASQCRTLGSRIREVSGLSFPNVWNLAYDRYDARMQTNIRAEARDARSHSIIQYIEDHGDIEALHAILSKMLMKWVSEAA